MSEPGPFLMLARMWLRSPGQLVCEREGRSLMRFNGWARSEGIEPLPLTPALLDQHADWLSVHFSAQAAKATLADLQAYRDWLYADVKEAPDQPSNPT